MGALANNTQWPALIAFDAQPIMADAELKHHVRRAVGFDLHGLLTPPKRIKVIANGPSALRAPLDGPTMALNGSLGMMLRRGVTPTWWACCDPQELVTEFLDVIPEETIYCVASKSHPKVFERLKFRDVVAWHVDDVEGLIGVSHTSTITLTSMNMMSELWGVEEFDVWGWDACFLDGKHHANETHGVRDGIECRIGSKVFQTTQAWACEAEEAGHVLQTVGYKVNIMGDGMIRAYVEA